MRRISFLLVLPVVAGVVCGEAAALAKMQVPGAQVALYRHGFYKGEIDGIAGPLTRRAIRQFQRSKRLEPDGVVGRRTRAAFGRFGGPLFGTRLLQRGNTGFDVSVLQFLLARRGLPVSLDGSFGPVTERLVRRFQRRAGLHPDGIVGRRTRAALLTGRVQTQSSPRSSGRRHVVRPGETLSSIAARAGTTVAALARRNKLDSSRFLLIGTRLVVPQGVGPSAPPASRAAVEASLSRWAAHYGVSLDLVRALAWQESGFQNHVRSSAGAVGVMQVIPATRAFVEQFLIGQHVPRTMDGNVRVGVAYLHHLLHLFGQDARLALGAYYSGPAAVMSHGLSRPTRRFVANVLALRGRV